MGIFGKLLNRSATKKSCDTVSTKPGSDYNGPHEEAVKPKKQKMGKKYDSSLEKIHQIQNFADDPLAEYSQELCKDDKGLFRKIKDDKKKKKRKDDGKRKSRERSIVNRKDRNSIYDIKL